MIMNKGQYFTLEQMLLFTTGIVITIGIYFSLVAANESIREVTKEDQMYEIGKLVSSQMSRVYLLPNETVMNIEIPKKISTETYNIYVETDGTNYNLTVKLPDRSVKIRIDGIYQAYGMVSSPSGMISIEKKNGQVKIGKFYGL